MARSGAESCKMPYTWWQRFQNCHSMHGDHLGNWNEYLAALFKAGVSNITSTEKPADALAPLTEVLSNKGYKTITVTPSPSMAEALDRLCNTTGYSKSQMIALSLRSGYDSTC